MVDLLLGFYCIQTLYFVSALESIPYLTEKFICWNDFIFSRATVVSLEDFETRLNQVSQ